MLIGLRVDGDLTVVEGKWGATAVKEIFRKSMYLPDRVYPDLKVGGQGISLSLKKIVDFFAGKVGTNAPQSASSSSSPIKLSSFSFTKLCPDVINLADDGDYDDGRVLGDRGGISQRENAKCAFLMEVNLRMQADIQVKDVANSICEKKLNEKILECESKKKMVEDLQMQLADKVKKCETLSIINDKLMEKVYVNQEAQPLPRTQQYRINLIYRNIVQGVWRLALKGAIEGGDIEDTEDPTYEELSRQFTKLLTIAQEGPKGEYEDDIILSGRGEYQEMIDSRLKKIDKRTNLRQTLFEPFNWFQLDIRDVERDGNTVFRVAASYAYKSQMKFLNVNDYLYTLMTKKPPYWKSVFSQRLDVAYSHLGERRYKTLLRAFKFNGVFVEYLYMGNLLAIYYEKVVIFISNKEALTFLPLFWPKANNKITKKKRFENILDDSTKYWWVGMT
ncbi:hypothetical protein GIB67_023948 [Kingdonia uniflora]|uniref:Uncharacterized protein n=1 Tax=Kingdonia uniflora TaxID=39325 RepID=A0A7J7M6E1_9MAGN|nr:hypothetical protein GIB67_023948 [Kingdonia uniflora]